MAVIVLLGALVLGLAAPGQAQAMTGHSAHATTAQATADMGPVGGSDAPVDHKGGCADGMMADCCVMTCCSATAPAFMGDGVRHVVIAARSSRPAVAGGRVVTPLLEPPKPLS